MIEFSKLKGWLADYITDDKTSAASPPLQPWEQSELVSLISI